MTGVVGRFAPSPSGPLHFGSVVTAVASFLDARAQGGRWLLRIDDLDPPRIAVGATDRILATLEALALEWDGAVVYQSARSEAYAQALAQLLEGEQAYRCRCARKDLGAGPYPGTCRQADLSATGARLAWRVRVDDHAIRINDCVQGEYVQRLAQHCGDFVVRRADGVYAYHLAAVVDDAWSGVTHITRGSDLLESSPGKCICSACWACRPPATPICRSCWTPMATNSASRPTRRQWTDQVRAARCFRPWIFSASHHRSRWWAPRLRSCWPGHCRAGVCLR